VGSLGGVRVAPPRDSLIDHWVYSVRVCGFTFQFVSLAQLRECLDHFSRKTHPSGRFAQPPPGVHWNHPWYERLPMWLFEEPKRQRVVKALGQALTVFESEGAA
jgi:hypothetical protein